MKKEIYFDHTNALSIKMDCSSIVIVLVLVLFTNFSYINITIIIYSMPIWVSHCSIFVHHPVHIPLLFITYFCPCVQMRIVFRQEGGEELEQQTYKRCHGVQQNPFVASEVVPSSCIVVTSVYDDPKKCPCPSKISLPFQNKCSLLHVQNKK